MTNTTTKLVAFTAILCCCTYAAAQSNYATEGPGMGSSESSGGSSTATSPMPSQQPGQENPFLGGVPPGPPEPGVMQLSIGDAIGRGLRYNLGLLLSDQDTQAARGARYKALSHLLPNISAGSSETIEQINLKALGFPSFPGVPPIIGPFSVFDVRGYVDQPILDLKDLHNVHAQSQNVKAARYTYQNARDLVVLVSANLYLQAVAGESRVDAAQAEVRTAQAVYDRALDMRKAGMVPGIDVLRSKVELQGQQQRLISLQNQFETEKLVLARAIGLPVAQEFHLTDKVPYTAPPSIAFEDALNRALHSRADYQSSLASVRAAQSLKKAARSEALPSLKFHADYGDIGPSPGVSHGTMAVSANLNIPIFQGGKVRGDVMEADALLRRRESELKDLRNKIEYQVRKSLMDLQSAEEQVKVAQDTVDLAHEQMEQAQDRFAAGVVNSLEVVQAEQALAVADESYISSLYSYNVAKASLARALGLAEEGFRQMIGGKQ
jgi:outer membrane protein TolC